jgi:uncharacterized membrane protein
MTSLATSAKTTRSSNASDWLIPLGLIALAFIPIVAGAFRLTALTSGAEITPENARFFASPVPVVLHIVSVTVYSVLGAFQFSPGLRRNRPGWHRAAGRILIAAGLLAALTGLWMALFYAIVPADTALLRGLRLLFGSAMALSIVFGFIAIRSGRVSAHRDWMRRAYAIGLGAGTQALIQIPVTMLAGKPEGLAPAFWMGAAWMINLGFAEWRTFRQRRN